MLSGLGLSMINECFELVTCVCGSGRRVKIGNDFLQFALKTVRDAALQGKTAHHVNKIQRQLAWTCFFLKRQCLHRGQHRETTGGSGSAKRIEEATDNSNSSTIAVRGHRGSRTPGVCGWIINLTE